MRVTEIQAAGKSSIATTVDGRIGIVVPIKVVQRSARKQIIPLSSGPALDAFPSKITPFQLALVRGHKWLSLLESGAATSLRKIASDERVDPSYVSRSINLTTLAPEICDAILDDNLPTTVSVVDLAIDPPLAWMHQFRRRCLIGRTLLSFVSRTPQTRV